MASKKGQKQDGKATLSDPKITSCLIPIIVALIGFMGVAVTAVFGYLGVVAVNKDKEIPLARAQSDWLSLVDFKYGWEVSSCGRGASLVVPDYITLVENDRSSLHAMESVAENVPSAPWPDFYDQKMTWGITITNLSSNTGDWVRIEKDMSVHLALISKDVSRHVSLWKMDGKGCGGGDYKRFSTINLNWNKDSLSQVITSEQYDYFSFQPGESDTFEFNFVCTSPGLYRPSIEMKVSYKGEEKAVTIMGDDMVLCPETFSLWHTYYPEETLATMESSGISLSPMMYSGEYKWDGTKYEKVKP